ncbi:protein JINGUBANG [Selaginella moellendorffii]|uniref:protein JINGUBANG n=1 Tax=Selaginella moellendorffii TaxID=88036 RepID=UPI000D1CBC65|nr:protein JINGUBANG [Selaginella moellendorffii]|eukprot:XP_024521542.1 protein JINGUBANG [Selaginella moellendorffii]
MASSSFRDPFDDLPISDSISDTTTSDKDQSEQQQQQFLLATAIDQLRPSSSSRSSAGFRCLLSFKPHASGICALAISDHSLYSGSEDGLVCSYRLADLQPSDRLAAASSGSVKALLVRRAGLEIYSAHQDHKIRAWSRASPSPPSQHRLIATLPTIRDVVATSIRGSKGLVRIRRHRKSPWNQHFDTISSLAVDEAAGILYSGSWDRSLKAWRLRDLRCLESIGDAHTDAINALAVAPRGGFLFSASADSSVKVWRWGKCDRSRKNHKNTKGSSDGLSFVVELAQPSPVNCIALWGSWVYAGCSDGRISVWMVAIEQEDEASPPRGAEDPSSSESGEEENQGIRVLREEPEIRVYREEFAALCGHSMSVLSISAARDVVCSGSADRTIRVWRREDERHSCVCVVQDLHSRCPIKSVIVSIEGIVDGCMVYSGGLDGFLKAWWVSLRSKPKIFGESPCSVLDYR